VLIAISNLFFYRQDAKAAKKNQFIFILSSRMAVTVIDKTLLSINPAEDETDVSLFITNPWRPWRLGG
jgi:hypothetical protein